MRILLLAFSAILIIQSGHASEVASAAAFYDRHAEGWFWYKDPKKKLVKEAPAESPKPSEKPKIEVLEAPAAVASPPGPAPMSVEWFQENFDEIQNRAINNPTPDNVAAFYAVHQQMMHRAAKFADVGQQVLLQYPGLDPRNRFSNSVSGEKNRQQTLSNFNQNIFAKLKELNGGLMFFYDNSAFSQQMADTVAGIARRFDVDIQPISTDGSEIPDKTIASLMLNSIEDEGLSKVVNVPFAPAVAIAIPPDRVQVVAYGTLSTNRVLARIPATANLMGLISEDELRVARGELPNAPNAALKTNLEDIEDNSTDAILRALKKGGAL